MVLPSTKPLAASACLNPSITCDSDPCGPKLAIATFFISAAGLRVAPSARTTRAAANTIRFIRNSFAFCWRMTPSKVASGSSGSCLQKIQCRPATGGFEHGAQRGCEHLRTRHADHRLPLGGCKIRAVRPCRLDFGNRVVERRIGDHAAATTIKPDGRERTGHHGVDVAWKQRRDLADRPVENDGFAGNV